MSFLHVFVNAFLNIEEAHKPDDANDSTCLRTSFRSTPGSDDTRWIIWQTERQQEGSSAA
jgi:hypothetical protein